MFAQLTSFKMLHSWPTTKSPHKFSSHFTEQTHICQYIKGAKIQDLCGGKFTQASDVSLKYVAIMYCTIASCSLGHPCPCLLAFDIYHPYIQLLVSFHLYRIRMRNV